MFYFVIENPTDKTKRYKQNNVFCFQRLSIYWSDKKIKMRYSTADFGGGTVI